MQISNDTDIICYFENGVLLKTHPSDECNQYHARYIVSDTKTHDMECEKDIGNIAIPHYSNINGLPNISHLLEYVIKRKAGDLSNRGMVDLSIACLRKANQLMAHSPIRWNVQDYFYIVKILVRAKRFNEAKQEISFIRNNYFDKYDYTTLRAEVLAKTLNYRRELNMDLVESDSAPNCSALSAKYRKRIYSLSGTNKNYPAMKPEIWSCGIMFFPFIEGVSKPKYCPESEMYAYNNRPFVDDRTDAEKKNYMKYLKQRILEEREAIDYLEYHHMKHIGIKSIPKSFRAYQDMKYEENNEMLNLIQLAGEYGIEIEIQKQKPQE